MSSGGGYSGGMGGYGGGFGGGFGQPPQFGGGFGGGFGQPPQFGGGFGGGFGQPPQYGGGFGSPYGGFGGGFGQPQQFGGGFGQPQQSPFGGGSQGPMLQAQGPNTLGNAYAQRFQNPFVKDIPQTSPNPNQPPPGMELNPDYIDRFAGGMAGTMDVRPTDNKFRPIQQPQTGNPPPGMIRNPNYTGPRQVPEGMFTTANIRPSEIEFISDPNYVPTGGGRPSNDQFFGNTQTFLPMIQPTPAQPAPQQGSYSPYMSPSIMGGLASLFGGMQGGGFQGMFNQQPQQQSYGSIQGNMRNPAYQQQMAFQQGNSEEATRNRIQSQLNEQFNRDKASGMSLMDMAKAQDELSSRLHSQYGLKQIRAELT